MTTGFDNSAPAPAVRHSTPAARLGYLALGAWLVMLTWLSGAPALDAPWIQGDEHRFIVNNEDVTGADRNSPRWRQYLGIFLHPHEDLYQPLPILTYALEWDFWGDERIAGIRRTDVLLHALNGLLLWGVLRALLRVFRGRPADTVANLLTYAAALTWTLHPVQASAYAADMGRTHLLSAAAALSSLWLYIAALEHRRWDAYLGSGALLLAAMMSKPIAGWFVIVLTVEWRMRGRRAAVRSPGVWWAFVLGAAFAYVTIDATADYLMFEDFELLVYGDPVSRSFYAVWLYAFNAVAPLWLSPWYLPAPEAVWTHPTVWLGVGLTLLSAALAWRAVRRPGLIGAAAGIAWAWVAVLPVIGLIGARVAAANDRYVYQPLMWLGLAAVVAADAWLMRRGKQVRRGVLTAITVAALGLAAAATPWNRALTAIERSTLQRGERIVALYPDHPRAWELLNIAYEFSATHDTYARRARGRDALLAEAQRVLDDAVARAAAHPQRFTSEYERAFFRRRTSFRYELYGQTDKAVALAEAAAEIEPNTPATLSRLAQAYRAAQRWDEARAAYERLAKQLEPDARFRGKRLIEFGDLLLHQFGDAAGAIRRFRAGLEDQRLEPEDRLVGEIGLALAEIRDATGVGRGARGHDLIIDVLKRHPESRAAKFVLGEFLLRSHQWPQAEAAYGWLVQQDPTDYRALRGLHEALAQQARFNDALRAWSDARRLKPESRTFRSFVVWSAACAQDPGAQAAANDLLALDPNNPLARAAEALLRTEAGDYAAARAALALAARGRPIPEERALTRFAARIEQFVAGERLPPAALALASEAWLASGQRSRAKRSLERLSTALDKGAELPPAAAAIVAELRARLGN